MSGKNLIAHWDLSTDNPPDICWRGNRYQGTGANIVGHPNGVAGGICAEFSGATSNVNVGDVAELNAVQEFTIALWANQDVLDQADVIFYKILNSSHRVYIYTSVGGSLYIQVQDGVAGSARVNDYSPVMPARSWHHLAFVFDGAGAAPTDRIKIYIDGAPQALVFTGTTPTQTADTTGFDAYIGYTVGAWDGKLDEFMIFDAALTQLQVVDLYERTRKGIW